MSEADDEVMVGSAAVAGISEVVAAAAPPRAYDGYHVYGGGGALKFEVSRHQKDQSVLVFMVDATRAVVAREFDWSNKVTIQLTANEGLMVLAVLMGGLQHFETAPHGESVKKLRIEDQGRNWYVRVSDRSQAVPVPMSPMDAAHVALLLARGFLEVHPYLGDLDGLMRFVSKFALRGQQVRGAETPRPAAAVDSGRSAPDPVQRSERYAERRPAQGQLQQKPGVDPRGESVAVQPKADRPGSSAQKSTDSRRSPPSASSSAQPVAGGSRPNSAPQQKFSVPATLAGIRQKTTVSELERARERISRTFNGEDLAKCLEAIEARRAELTRAMAD